MLSVARYARWLAVIILVLLPIAAIPLLGTSAAVVSIALVALVTSILLARSAGWRPGRVWWTTVVAGLTLLGGLVGVASAISGVLAVGAVEPYTQRVGFGYAALELAVIAGVAGTFAAKWRRVSATVMVAAGLAGAVSINMFYINTFYVLAVPLWLIAAVATLMAPRSSPAHE